MQMNANATWLNWRNLDQFISGVESRIEENTRHPAIQAPSDWPTWLSRLLAGYATAQPAQRHRDLWDWGWAIEPGVRPRPFVAIWPRGGAKSTTAELLTVAIGARNQRRYVWYVCETQDQADKHIDTIASMLESSEVERYYPALSSRKVGKYGNSRGWRRNRLRTGSGFTIDAMGLDTASRGAKVEDARPDLMILDDIDGKLDSPATTERKIATITTSLLPAGSNDLAVLAIQNLIIMDGVFSQLADGRAEFLNDRIVSGPHPAVSDLAVDQTPAGYVITGGAATWEGQPLPICQQQIRDWGLTAFRAEAQHDVQAPPGGMFDHLDFRHCAWDEVPELVRVSVWVDPAVTATDQSDSMGIQADGLSADGKIYRLWSWEQITTPEDALRRAILKAVELGSHTVGVETDQGGDTWRSVYARAIDKLVDEGRLTQSQAPAFRSDKAGAGHGPKVHRASQMLTAYERGVFVHVTGTHAALENALKRFPKTKPFDLTDAAYWTWADLSGLNPRSLVAFV